MTYVRIGSDPETFLMDATGRYISSVGLIGGSKDEPMPIGNGCSVQEDNVTVEFNTPPTNNPEEFVNAINYNLDWITRRASELNLSVVFTPSAEFDDEQLNSDAAQTFGCDPDFNAWEFGAANPRPRSKNRNLRSAGGHIHIEAPDLDKLELVKAMDLFVGVPMLKFDQDKRRRQLYGKAGAYRPKSYGIEYRSASNAWLANDETKKWAFEQTQKAVEFVRSGKEIPDDLGDMIQEAINTSNPAFVNDIEHWAASL
jgi:hypothetical protein